MRALLGLGLVIAALAPAPARAVHEYSIVVLPFVVGGGIEEKKAALIDEVYLTELSRLAPPGVKIIGASDVIAMLGQAQQKQLAGCSDTSCLVEVGNALGANLLVASTFGKVGDRFVVNSKLLHVESASVLWRDVLYLGATEGELLDAMRTLARNLAVGQGWIDAQGNRITAASSAPAASTPTSTTATPALASAAGGTANAGTTSTTAAATGSGGPGLLVWIGGGAAGIGALTAGGCALALYFLDRQAADGNADYADRRTAGAVGVVTVIGATLGGALTITGTILASVALLGD